MKKIMLALAALTLTFAAGPTLAAVVDLNTELTQLDGKSIYNPADDLSPTEAAVVQGLVARGYLLVKPKRSTLGDMAIQALMIPDQKDTPEEKSHKFGVAFKLQKVISQNVGKADVDLSVEDLKLLKDVIGHTYGPLIVGQSWRILDPPTAAQK